VNVNKELCLIILPYRNTSFCSIYIKSYLIKENNNKHIPNSKSLPKLVKELPRLNSIYKRGRSRKNQELVVNYETYLQTNEE
jgi:hypothetical protein